MTPLQSFVAQGRDEHTDDAAGVARRLPQGIPMVRDEPELLQLANLAHHVYGEHLAAWDEGLAFLRTLSDTPFCDNYGEGGNAIRRYRASLMLAGGREDQRGEFGPSDFIRIGALAASAIASSDTERALKLFEETLAEARSAALAPADPMNRALAIAGNNLAASLEEKAERTPRERELMILAAQTGREFWAVAGSWLETERAEYRLAMSWLAAGDPGQARAHALACLEIVAAQQEPDPAERFTGLEALARAEHAAGDTAAFAQARERMQQLLATLSDDDRGWCQPILESLPA